MISGEQCAELGVPLLYIGSLVVIPKRWAQGSTTFNFDPSDGDLLNAKWIVEWIVVCDVRGSDTTKHFLALFLLLHNGTRAKRLLLPQSHHSKMWLRLPRPFVDDACWCVCSVFHALTKAQGVRSVGSEWRADRSQIQLILWRYTKYYLTFWALLTGWKETTCDQRTHHTLYVHSLSQPIISRIRTKQGKVTFARSSASFCMKHLFRFRRSIRKIYYLGLSD